MSFLEWLSRHQETELLLECVISETTDIESVRDQINGMFDDAIKTLVQIGKISKKDHVIQAKNSTGYDWWAGLLRVMRDYPFKGPDLYDAATTLAGDLWEKVFNPKRYEDRNPPLAIFHKMASIRAQDIAFRFFGWRRKLKTSNYSDLPNQISEPSIQDDADLEWKELQFKLLQSIENESSTEKNRDRAKRAIDVMNVKLSGYSKLYNKRVTETGLDSLAGFYHVTRREMYDTFLIVYRAVKKMAKEENVDLLQKVMGQLPDSLTRDPEEIVLSLIPLSGEISHSDLFTKAYSSNRELKSLKFKQIIQRLLDRKQINTRKDDRVGKHQVLYQRIA